MKTASWFQRLPLDHQPIGISRGVPRHQKAGYRVYRELAPGPWFDSVSPKEYYWLYRTEILAPLNPTAVVAELYRLSAGRTPTLLCFEHPSGECWCHRANGGGMAGRSPRRTRPGIRFRKPPAA